MNIWPRNASKVKDTFDFINNYYLGFIINFIDF